MAKIPLQKVQVYKTNEDGLLTGTTVTLDNVQNIQVMKGIDEAKDVFSFEIPVYKHGGVWYNTAGNLTVGDRVINVNDVIAISAKYSTDSDWSDDNILIFGNIRKLSYTDNMKRNRIKVDGVNRTEELLKGMVPYTTVGTTSQTETPDNIILNMFKRLNTHNSNHKVFAYKDTYTIPETGAVGGIATTKSDGTAFTAVQYTSTWKPIYMQLEDLSKPEYTGDVLGGQYIFYVKPVKVLEHYQDPNLKNGPYADVFFWKNVGSVYSGSIIEGTGVTDINVLHDNRDVINAAIVNAGTDLKGAGILTVAYDIDSIGKNGAKWVYYTKSRKKFRHLYEDYEKRLAENQGSVFDADTGFPPTGSFPWNFQYDGTSGDSAANQTEFNQKLRDKAKDVSEAEAFNMISFLKNPKYDVTFDLEIGSNNYTMGDLYYFQIPSFGWDGTQAKPGKILRLHDETHILGTQGWQTRITAREDEEIVRDNVEGTN